MAIVFAFLVIISVFTSTKSLAGLFTHSLSSANLKEYNEYQEYEEDKESEEYEYYNSYDKFEKYKDDNEYKENEKYGDFNEYKRYVKNRYFLGRPKISSFIEKLVSFFSTILKPLKYSFTSVNTFMRSTEFR